MGEHHCPSADDRVQPDPASRESTDWPRWLLEALGWHCCHACLRLRWRDQGSESMAGLSSSSRSLPGSLLRHLAPPTCQTPSSSLSTTCVSSCAWDGPSIQQATSLARSTNRLVQPKHST